MLAARQALLTWLELHGVATKKLMRAVKTAIGGLSAASRVALTGNYLPAPMAKIGSASALDLALELQISLHTSNPGFGGPQ